MKTTEVNRTKILAVEGKDEINFFDAFFSYLGINDIQIFEVGGKNRFKDKFNALINLPNFSNVNRIGIVRDIDNEEIDDVLRSLQGIIESFGFEFPENVVSFTESNPSIGIYLMPNNKQQGMLEDLCLQSKIGDPILSCIEDFSNCLSNTPNHQAKFRTKCYLAAVDPSIPSLGIAAQRRVWDFSNTCFDDIRTFVRNLDDTS